MSRVSERVIRLRQDLGLTGMSAVLGPELRAVSAPATAALTERLRHQVTRFHVQNLGRRQLLESAVEAAVGDFVHLVAGGQWPTRAVEPLFHRLGEAEATAGWELDAVLEALDAVRAALWEHYGSHPFLGQHAPTLSVALIGYLDRLHGEARAGHSAALLRGQYLGPLTRRPRPELEITQMLRRWGPAVRTFQVQVRSKDAAKVRHAQGTGVDHVAVVTPHPAPRPRSTRGIVVWRGPVPSRDVITSYQTCTLVLRMLAAGLAGASSPLPCPDPEFALLSLRPGTTLVVRDMPMLRRLAQVPREDRARLGRALYLHLISPHHVGELADHFGLARDRVEADHVRLRGLLGSMIDATSNTLGMCAVLQILVALWELEAVTETPETAASDDSL